MQKLNKTQLSLGTNHKFSVAAVSGVLGVNAGLGKESVQQGCHFEWTYMSFNVIRVNSRKNLEQWKNFKYWSDSVYHLCSKNVSKICKEFGLERGRLETLKARGRLY